MIGRTETRTRDRIYCQTIRTVRDISRDDRARIATCSLRTLTDRHRYCHRHSRNEEHLPRSIHNICEDTYFIIALPHNQFSLPLRILGNCALRHYLRKGRFWLLWNLSCRFVDAVFRACPLSFQPTEVVGM